MRARGVPVLLLVGVTLGCEPGGAPRGGEQGAPAKVGAVERTKARPGAGTAVAPAQHAAAGSAAAERNVAGLVDRKEKASDEAAVDRNGSGSDVAKPGAIEWSGPVAWRDWESGLAEAARTGKNICLVVYADWCSKCRKLAPVFRDPEVAKLAEDLVMIRLDADDAPASVESKIRQFGSYVPRVLFLDSSGNPREALQAPNPRYPYFYTPEAVGPLKTNMRQAANG